MKPIVLESTPDVNGCMKLPHKNLQELSRTGLTVVDQFLAPDGLQAINEEFDTLLEKFRPAQVKSGAPSIRHDQIYWLDQPLSPPLNLLQQEWESWIPLFNQEFFCGISGIETHLALYPEGDGYLKHWDQALGGHARKISLVLYLNLGWRPQDGGQLRFYNDMQHARPFCEVLPQGGRLVLFRSDLFPHEVMGSRRPRRSLTGWFRSDAL